MHKNAVGLERKAIIDQVISGEPSVKDYAHYVVIGNANEKVKKWFNQGAEIIYVTSRKEYKEIQDIQNLLNENNFPKGKLEYREQNEEYKDVGEKIMPDILIEDDCESIGGEKEMVYPHIKSELKGKINSVVVKEFEGIDRLPDNISEF